MKIKKSTIIRTLAILLVVVNMVLQKFGIDPLGITENQIAMAVQSIIEIGAIAAAWWYNNSFTENAKKADEFFKQLKNEK